MWEHCVLFQHFAWSFLIDVNAVPASTKHSCIFILTEFWKSVSKSTFNEEQKKCKKWVDSAGCTGNYRTFTYYLSLWNLERRKTYGSKERRKRDHVENSQRNVSPMSVLIIRANTISETLQIQLSSTTCFCPFWPSSGRQNIKCVSMCVKGRFPTRYSLPCMFCKIYEDGQKTAETCRWQLKIQCSKIVCSHWQSQFLG